MSVGDTILDATSEAGFDENWCLIVNKSMWNAFINFKYMSNTRDSPDGKYRHLYFNTGVTYTNHICELSGYSYPV